MGDHLYLGDEAQAYPVQGAGLGRKVCKAQDGARKVRGGIAAAARGLRSLLFLGVSGVLRVLRC